MAKLIPAPPTSGSTTTLTFTTSQNWTSPAGVTNLITVSGKGQDGLPAVNPTPGVPVSRSAVVTLVTYTETITSATYSGTYYWQYLQSVAPNATSVVNAGGTGYFSSTVLDAYSGTAFDSYSYNLSQPSVAFTNAIPGTASYSVSSGWLTRGVVGSSATATIVWQEYGTATGGSPATTGSDTTGLGKTWNGGVGTAAVGTSYNNVTITASTVYALVIPSGGFITITY